MENGRCVGVQTEIDGTSHPFTTQAVVLADGGFQAAPELLRKHIAKAPERLHQRNAGTGTGDGLQMALQLGAAAVGLNRFYGHLISLDALTNENLWPYPYFDSLVGAAILVDGAGNRIDDEGLGGVHSNSEGSILCRTRLRWDYLYDGRYRDRGRCPSITWG